MATPPRHRQLADQRLPDQQPGNLISAILFRLWIGSSIMPAARPVHAERGSNGEPAPIGLIVAGLGERIRKGAALT
ncbi:MAG: hypothetical protein U0Z44_12130 [Kouleothrix sp.]